jgi:hypothetical protein|nr:MAG TPA: hypothetical protein [Caudoviricetes sp.]
MKLDFKQKIVMFYGNILRVNFDAMYIAADGNGEVYSYNDKPIILENENIWKGLYSTYAGAVATFDENEDWKDTLINCEGEGHEWMLTLRNRMAIEFMRANLHEGILTDEAFRSTIASLKDTITPASIKEQWDSFYKHSGVTTVVSKEFVDAFKEKLFTETVPFIKAEKFVYPEDDSLLIRDYYGTGLIIPKTVHFIAMDSNGSVWAYEEHPVATTGDDGEWMTTGFKNAFIVGWRSQNTAGKKWRDSLRKVQL